MVSTTFQHRPRIAINQERLSMIVKGTISEYFGQQLTPDLIEELAKKMTVEFEKFLNTDL